jgi:hypothetical protein
VNVKALFSAGSENTCPGFGGRKLNLVVALFGRGNLKTLPFFVTSGEIE